MINFELEYKDARRSPRISMKLAKLRPALPEGISVTHDEWEVLRQTNRER
mgnify:FL=1